MNVLNIKQKILLKQTSIKNTHNQPNIIKVQNSNDLLKKKISKLRKYLANKLNINKRNKNRKKYKKANNIYKKKLKQVNKKITKNELKHFKWHKNVPLKLREEIFAIVKDLYKRKGIYVASEMKRILLKYQDRIGKEKLILVELVVLSIKSG